MQLPLIKINTTAFSWKLRSQQCLFTWISHEDSIFYQAAVVVAHASRVCCKSQENVIFTLLTQLSLFMMKDSMSAAVQEFLLMEGTGMRMQQAQCQRDKGITYSGIEGEEVPGWTEYGSLFYLFFQHCWEFSLEQAGKQSMEPFQRLCWLKGQRKPSRDETQNRSVLSPCGGSKKLWAPVTACGIFYWTISEVFCCGLYFWVSALLVLVAFCNFISQNYWKF